MKQRYEIPLPLDEVKERLRADMQTDWPLGKLLRSVKRPANDRRGLYGQIEGERLWAVMMHGYDMYPKRVFFGTLRAQGDHTILEGGFRYPMQVLLKLAVLLAWILFGIIRIGVYTAPALLIVPGRLINRENDRTVREYFQRASRGEPFAQEVNPE